MKPARTGWFWLSLLALLALGGCINLKQELWLNADGSGKMTVDMGVSKSFLEVLSNSGTSDGRSPFQALKDQYEGSADPLVKNLSPRQYTENEMEHYAVSFEVTDMRQYIEQQAARSQGGIADLSLKKLENGNLEFAQVLDPGGQAAGLAGLDLSQVGTLFKDQYWIVVLHASGAVRVDPTGSIQDDGATVEWKIPIAQLAASKTPIRLTAELKPQSAGLSGLDFSLVAVLAAAALVVGLIIFLRRPRRPAEEDDPHPYAPYPPASRPDREG
jgi:hypothetical protein